VSAEAMGEWLGIERESVYRLERKPGRIKSETQAAYAAKLGIEPEDLWRLPGGPSLDGLAASVPEDLRGLATEVAADALRRFVARRG